MPSTWARSGRWRAILDIPDEVDLAVVAVPAAPVAGGSGGVRAQAGVRRGGPVGGVRRTGRRRCRARGGGAPDGAVLGHPAGRPELPRRHQHRSRRPAPRHASCTWSPAPVGCRSCRSRGWSAPPSSPRPPSWAWGSRRSWPWATAPTCRATICSSTGRATTAPTWCACTSRASATLVTSAGWPVASRRAKPVVAVKAGWSPDDPADTGGRRHRGRAPAPDRGDPGAHPARHARHDPAPASSQPLPAGRRVAVVGNAGGSLAIAADAAPRRRPGAGAELRPAPGDDRQCIDLGRRGGRPRATPSRHDIERGRWPGRRPGVDAILVLYAPSLGWLSRRRCRRAIDAGARRQPEVPVVACFYGPLPTPARSPDRSRSTTPSTPRPGPSDGWRPTRRGWPARGQPSEASTPAGWPPCGTAGARSRSRRRRLDLAEPATLALLAAAGLDRAPHRGGR